MDKRVKWNYEKVKEYVENQGYKLITTEYKNPSTKLKMIYPKGHEVEISWGNFHNSNRRCRYCGRKRASDKQKLTIEYVRSRFEERGCVLLEEEYIDAKTLMRYICPNGHEHKINWSNFNTGQGCPKCRDKKLREERQYSQKYVFDYIESFGYKVLSEEYINARTPLDLLCPEKHQCSITFWDFKKGSRCNICENKYKGERKISQYLDNNFIEYISQKRFEDCRNILPLPFDFYIPSLNLVIEYDGEQHFKIAFGNGEEELQERKRKDEIKNNYCKQNNINILRIPYWEFENIENIICQEIKKLKTFDGQVS